MNGEVVSGGWISACYYKTTAPYKGRFMFYYATDEEVKKYFEDNKVN